MTALLLVAGAVCAALSAALALGRPASLDVPVRAATGTSPREPSAAGLPRMRAAAALGAALTVGLLLPGWYAVVGAGLAAALMWRWSRSWEDREVRRRRERLAGEVLPVVDLLSAAVSAGASAAYALHEVAALSEGVAADTLLPWSRRLRWGSEPVEVWADMARHEQFGRLGQTLLRSATSGAPVAAALERLTEDERVRHRGEVEARVRQIEVRASAPLGLCLLPAFVLLGIVPLVAGAITGLVLV